MTTLGDEEWRLIRLAYFGGNETLDQIAQRFGVTRQLIVYHGRREGWPPHAKARAGFSGPQAVIERFYRLIDRKLEQMEVTMASDEVRSPADNERETRAIGTLIRNFERVFGLDQGTDYGDGREELRGGELDPDRDAEAIRRELAARLERLLAVNRERMDAAPADD